MGIASKLDRIIQIERFALVDGPFGPEEGWATFGPPLPALRQDISDGERGRAGQVFATLTTRFQVRNTPMTRTITASDRIVHEGRTLEIVGVKEAQQYGRRQLIEITTAGSNNG